MGTGFGMVNGRGKNQPACRHTVAMLCNTRVSVGFTLERSAGILAFADWKVRAMLELLGGPPCSGRDAYMHGVAGRINHLPSTPSGNILRKPGLGGYPDPEN